MKPVTIFRPKMFLLRDEFATFSWAGKLVILEGWDRTEALLMACSYYSLEYTDRRTDMFDKFLDEGAFKVVQVPNRLSGKKISLYIKERFG